MAAVELAVGEGGGGFVDVIEEMMIVLGGHGPIGEAEGDLGGGRAGPTFAAQGWAADVPGAIGAAGGEVMGTGAGGGEEASGIREIAAVIGIDREETGDVGDGNGQGVD